MWIKYVILRLATQPDIFMEWPPLLSRSCQPGQFWLSCKIAEFESQCPCYLQQTFRYISIYISFVDFRATCLLCLNWMWVPLQSVPLQCFNVSTQICCRPPFANSSCLPAHRPIRGVQKIQKLSETPATVHRVAKLCINDSKNKKKHEKLVQPVAPHLCMNPKPQKWLISKRSQTYWVGYQITSE